MGWPVRSDADMTCHHRYEAKILTSCFVGARNDANTAMPPFLRNTASRNARLVAQKAAPRRPSHRGTARQQSIEHVHVELVEVEDDASREPKGYLQELHVATDVDDIHDFVKIIADRGDVLV